MTNHVLCFDSSRHHHGPPAATNVETLFRLLDDGDEQVTWYHSGARPADGGGRLGVLRWREAAAQDARAAIAEAYEFLVGRWTPGDRIYMFGGGRGAYCAQALARLLGTVGLLPELTDYVLAAYAVPRTPRTPQDWRRVTHLAARLSGRREIGVPVWFLGLWDSAKVPGSARRSMPDSPNVVYGRHAVAIDGIFGERLATSGRIEEVWFRGAHCDVVGGPGACRPLADIALDWMLDGAVRAGVGVAARHRYTAPAPSEVDALAGSARTISVRKLPPDAVLHASVEVYLHEHPEYWRRLPAHVIWADRHWVDRSERLVQAAPPRPVPSRAVPSRAAPSPAAGQPVVEPAVLTAKAS